MQHSDGSFERYRYAVSGGLSEAGNESAEVHFERDDLGRVTRELTRLPDGTEHWIKSGYGPDGHCVRMQSSDGHLHHIEREEVGDVQVDFERDALGLEVSRSFPGGVASRWDRDTAGRPTRRTILSAAEGIVDDKRYEWEGEDQIRAILDAQHGDARYTHDNRGRLVAARLPWGEEQQRAMDAVGNIYGSPDRSDRRYGAGGRLEEADGTTYRHDEDGNLIEKADLLGEATRYRWNGAGMLSAVELPDGREVSFTYDVMARRLAKVVHGPTGGNGELSVSKEVRWVWDGHNPLVELDSDEGKTTWVFDPETFNPLAKLKNGAVWGVVTDQIGTPTELIAQDGSVAYSTHVDVHGESRPVKAETKCPFRWPGQYADEETGLHYNRWRYFDSATAKFVSIDPMGPTARGLEPYGGMRDAASEIDPLGLYFRSTTPVGYWDNDFEPELDSMHGGGGSSHPLGHPQISRIGQNVAVVELVDGTRVAFRSGINGHSEQAMIAALARGNVDPTQVRRIYSELSPCAERCLPALRTWLGEHAGNVDLEYTWLHGDSESYGDRRSQKKSRCGG